MYFNYNIQISPWYSVKWKSPTQMYHVCVCVLSHFSHVWFFMTLWTVACLAPPSLGFSRHEYWSELPCLSPGDLPDPGIKPVSLTIPCVGRWLLYHLCHLLFIFQVLWKHFIPKGCWYEDSWEPEMAGRSMCSDPQGLGQTEARSIHWWCHRPQGRRPRLCVGMWSCDWHLEGGTHSSDFRLVLRLRCSTVATPSGYWEQKLGGMCPLHQQQLEFSSPKLSLSVNEYCL